MAAVTKVDFAPILQKVIEVTITTPEILKNGFKVCVDYIHGIRIILILTNVMAKT